MFRFALAATMAFLALAEPTYAQGTLPVALSQQTSANGRPLAGAKLYTYVVGTVQTRQATFSDTALTIPLPFPLVADQNGRIPMFYLGGTAVHAKLTTSAGVVQFDYPNMLVIGGTSSGGGGTIVDPSTISSTGDVKFRPTAEVLTGWIKMNGQTIGSATSGATGRANADVQALYIYLWTNCNDLHCAVVSGRGASAGADFSANKLLTLPDWRGRAPVGLDDMGSTPAGIIHTNNLTCIGDTPTTPFGCGGESQHAILLAELPAYTPAGTNAVSGSTENYTPTGSIGGTSQSYAPAGSISGTSQNYTPAGTIGGTTQSYTPAGTVVVNLSDPTHAHTETYNSRADISIGGAQTLVTSIQTTGGSTAVNVQANSTGISVSSSPFTGTPATVTLGANASFAGTPATVPLGANATFAGSTTTVPLGANATFTGSLVNISLGARANVVFTGTAQGGTSALTNRMGPFVLGTWHMKI